MVQKILRSGDPRLREKSKEVGKVDKKVHELIRDLKDTLVVQKDPEGVGLAAPQIGKNVRVFVIEHKKELVTMINPEITKIEAIKKVKSDKKKSSIMEGCLSLPNYYGPLVRNPKVTVNYTTPEGERQTQDFEGLPAQIIQHEVDHLNGVLFIDRLLEQQKPLFQLIGDKWEEVEL